MAKNWVYFALLVVVSGGILFAARTEKLNEPKDPPLVSIGDTARLTFQVSPLSGKGLLSEQTREALKAILKLNGGAQIVHIRAFSAGNGDVRRIPQIVADVLGSRKPLPSVSVIQAGELTQDGAQVVLEAVSAGKKNINNDGLTFYPAEPVIAIDPAANVKPFLQQAMDKLAAKMANHAALSVTCYVSTLGNGSELLAMVRSRFANAAVNLVQPRRVPWQAEASCEGVSRGGNTAARIAFSGTQIAFGAEAKDAAVAVKRLDRALGEAGAPLVTGAALVRFYILSREVAAIAKKQINDPTPSSVIPVENVGATSAGLAVDAVVPIP